MKWSLATMNEMTVKKKSSFNKEQQAAIDADSKHDILISAGAGSGKTKTLSERVYRLIESKDIKPSELLVLTFTNNAAHEMKERIIARFKKDNSPLAEEMPSAHVQTFDSFSQYLVSTYAGRLGISNRISVANESVMNAKKAEILDQVFSHYYDDPVLRERLVKTLTKFNTRDDKRLKKIVIDLDRQLEKMLPSDKKDFIEHYDERYLSREAYDVSQKEYVDDTKNTIIYAICEAYFLDRYYREVCSEEMDLSRIREIFSNKTFFSQDYRSFHFSDKVYCEPLYQAILPILEKEGFDFIDAVESFPKEKEVLIKKYGAKDEGDPETFAKNKAVWTILRSLFATSDAELSDVMEIVSEDDGDYKMFLSFKEDIHLLLDIVTEMEDALFDFKKSINTFTFADIATMALRLVTEPKFADVAKEIRGRFKYIMVDEYQDTNDFQETFINSLLEPDENGNRAHLFCVGDAKQAIYAFRNSNVELFRNRQREYDSSDVNEVIHMNRNYRSGKQLLKEINYIFSYYMSEDHGSIDYKDEREQLKYDDEVNIYGEPYNGFGIYRIVGDEAMDLKGQEKVVWEAKATIALIKKMVDECYPVYDRGATGNKIRPCAYKDFAIITRKKAGFALYQKLFNEEGIPLNISVSTNLREIDAIILLQSIISLIAWRKYGEKVDVKHLFASVARSYAYQYSDEDIYRLISYKGIEAGDDRDDDLSLILKDPIMVTLDEFCEKHKDSSFNTIFLDLLSSFHIIEKLYLIGEIDDNVAKIESLHQMVLSEEKAGEGLKEFVRLLQSIKKYELDLKVDSDYEIENSVDLMTIHASKGLERKIVIMPASLTSIGKGDARKKPDYDFSKELGILLPNYTYLAKEVNEKGEEVEVPTPVHSIPYKVLKRRKWMYNPEEDEHVRLLYVALTRAENAVYIVGDDPKKPGSLYEMLKYVPEYERFHEKMMEEKISSGVIEKELYDRYLELVDFTQNTSLPLSILDLPKEQYDIYVYLGEKYYLDPGKEELEKVIQKIKLDLYLDYWKKSKDISEEDLDYWAKLYGAWEFPSLHISSFSELVDAIIEMVEAKNEDEEEDEDEEESPRGTIPSGLLGFDSPNKGGFIEDIRNGRKVPTSEEVAVLVKHFAKALREEDISFLGIDEIPKNALGDKETYIHETMCDAFLNAFALAIDGYEYVSEISYASDIYPDHVAHYFGEYKESSKVIKAPAIKDLPLSQINDDDIPFEIREKRRASKGAPIDDDTPIQELLDTGVRLHRLMELVNWKTRDTSFIKNSEDRAIVEGILGLPLFLEAKDAKFFPEYGYYDEDYKTTGFIDLLMVENGIYTIIDWKTKNIDDSAYVEQLHTYKRNIKRIFGVSEEKIRLALVSLLDKRIKIVE